MTQSLEQTKLIAPWKRRSRLMTILARLLLPTKLLAEELPEPGRATNPALNGVQIEYLMDWLADWAHEEANARMDYMDNVRDDPERGDLYFQAYRQRCEQAQQQFSQRLKDTLNPRSSLDEETLRVRVPPGEIHTAFELATNFKNWLVRRCFPSEYGDSQVAYERAKWFFVNYLCMWEKPRVHESQL